jgi:S1-C subfamily serine protease
VINLSPAVAEEFRLDASAQGVVVADVENGSAAQIVGLQPGDLVLQVNGQKVARSRDLEKLTQTPQRAWQLQISRGGQVMNTVVGG